jgi:hypothetical protein
MTAAVIVVAVIVGLGLLWALVSGSGTGAVSRPPQQVIMRMEQVKAGAVAVHPDDGFQLGNARNLIQTGAIEAVLAAAVITASAFWRQHRRRARGFSGAGSPGAGR